MKKSIMKKSIVILIIAIIIIVATVFVVIPAVKTSTLKIKYISGGSEGDGVSYAGVSYGGKILILIDYLAPKSADWIHSEGHADQYITFSGLSIGRHVIEIDTGVWGDMNGTLLARGNITSHAAILGDTTIDLHYADGIF